VAGQLLKKEEQSAVLDWVDAQIGRIHARGSVGASEQASPGTRGELRAPLRPGTVSAVAQKLGATSCRALLTAAAAYLSIFQGKESFTRDELIACAKGARSWKADYTNQMATNITRMLDAGVLFEKAKDDFSLSDGELKSLEIKLSQFGAA